MGELQLHPKSTISRTLRAYDYTTHSHVGEESHRTGLTSCSYEIHKFLMCFYLLSNAVCICL